MAEIIKSSPSAPKDSDPAAPSSHGGSDGKPPVAPGIEGSSPSSGSEGVEISETTLLRPEDLLCLKLEFKNLRLVPGRKGARLVRTKCHEPAYITVHFPPQSIAEEAFDGPESNPPPPAPPPIRSRMAGPSRLVFKLPDEMEWIHYTTSDLLDWSRLDLVVASTALPPVPTQEDLEVKPRPAEPGAWETAIEAPYRLFLSPNRTAGWAHARDVVTHDGRTELWHTRLGVRDQGRVDEEDSATRTVRVIWSRDYPSTPPGSPPLEPTSLSPSERYRLVVQSADFTLVDRKTGMPYLPPPIRVERLMLTSLGAWTSINGRWELSEDLLEQGLKIEEWRHVATAGRDHYVRVVEAGFLLPTGHRASKVTVTERKIQSRDGAVIAYLRKKEFVIPQQRDKSYAGAPYEFEGREMPFSQSVRIMTTVTPALDPTANEPAAIIDRRSNTPVPTGAFWVLVGGAPFQFDVIADDAEGDPCPFGAAMIFVPYDVNENPAIMDIIAAAYRASPWRRCAVLGRDVALAKPTATSEMGETKLTTDALYFDVVRTTAPLPGGLSFLPRLDVANVRVPAVQQLLDVRAPQPIRLFEGYLRDGFDKERNKAQLFAQLDRVTNLPFSAERAGGLVTPSMDVTGLSQNLGPVGGNLKELAAGVFKPEEFFDKVNAKLLGGIRLADIVDSEFNRAQLPKLRTERRPRTGMPESFVTTLDWSPKVNPKGPLQQIKPNTRITLDVKARIEKKVAGGEPDFTVTGELRNFSIAFFEVIEVRFTSLKFVARNGRKVEVTPKIAKDGVQFGGPLKFVRKLQEAIPKGLSAPPGIDISSTGVTVAYRLSLPPIAVGVFALQNISFSLGLYLPFSDPADKARLRFAFADRHNPFQLTVALFGGGGFFNLSVGLDGIEQLEAALEFGGSFSLNLGVASGGVHVMAGIYFKAEVAKLAGGEDQWRVDLTGYLRCGGSLEVLGLITVSVEFYMGLTYTVPGGKVRGQATLTVRVEVLFFSKSVSLTVERSFGGSSGDPTFAEMLTAGDWIEYGRAFADDLSPAPACEAGDARSG